LNDLILKFIGTQNNRAFFQPSISFISNISLQKISSLLIKSIKIISFSTKNSIELDISQLFYLMESDYKIFDKNLKWNFIFDFIKKENFMIFTPLSFDIELNLLCNYLKKIGNYEDKWCHYSFEDTIVAQCSLGSIFRFYSLSKKIFRNGIFNKKFQTKIHINFDEKKK
jgi:hypothetical protein